MTKKRYNKATLYLPLCIAAGIAGGVLAGYFMSGKHSISPEQKKFEEIMSLISTEYVDSVGMGELLEMTLPSLLANLDPHSAYIPKSDLKEVNDDLEGSFSGVGISFQLLNDSVTVIEVIPGGPAEKVGLCAGDRIVRADTTALSGVGITNEGVFKTLRGEKGSKVKLEIKRQNSSKTYTYDVVRGEIPVNSIDSHYMIADGIGYIKVGKFARHTYQEFLEALSDLSAAGAKKYIIDLRGNSGGFMEQAILMANEFLPAGRKIVYTKARMADNEMEALSDGNGNFINNQLVVLTDDYSASASEIFAGAVQDNDRGLVIGRRTFGKGLVQNQTMLSDSSAVRLTVARYFTPAGRSIQKEYKRGDDVKYGMDIADRFTHGEFYHADSIKLDKSKKFYTHNGRIVYGGGGIMPDIFVPEDTTGVTGYYIAVNNSGLIQKYAFQVTDRYRGLLKNAKTVEDVMRLIPRDQTLLSNFVDFAVSNGVPARWYYINQSRDLLLNQIKAVIVRDALGYDEFFEVLNRSDNVVQRALKALQNGESPLSISQTKTKKR